MLEGSARVLQLDEAERAHLFGLARAAVPAVPGAPRHPAAQQVPAERASHPRLDDHDRWIDCTDRELRIRGYYFPWGSKRIPYGKIGAVRRVQITATWGERPHLGHGQSALLGQSRPEAPQ